MCGRIPGPVYPLCNYQLEFISPENNNSLPLCAAKDPGPAAVCEQSIISVVLQQCDTHSESEEAAARESYILLYACTV